MITKNIVLPNRYYDSVVLMNAAGKIKQRLEMDQVSLMMGTEANKEILRATKLLTDEGEAAEPGDLIIALMADDGAKFDKVTGVMEEILAPKAQTESVDYSPRSMEAAVKMLPGANLALISIPGDYVDWEGQKALENGLHLMLFSDNVPLESEIKLKKMGQEKGLLVMGPDCGTCIIHGAALGFANVIRRGEIGLVAAAGTGIQEVTTLIHKLGGGITHAIGTGGKDLSKEVGGITMKMGIQALREDPETKVLVLVSKPPHPDVEKSMYEALRGIDKPVVINFLGSDGVEAKKQGFIFAKTLEEAALKAMQALGKKAELPHPEDMEDRIREETGKTAPSQKYIRALYSGGTICSETRIILEEAGLEIFSNVTKDPKFKLKDVFKSTKHTLVDMGDDDFTRGAPHPMIDNTKRIARMMEEANDPETTVMLIDVVIGYGSNMDPAGEIAEAAEKAQEMAHKNGRHIIFVSSVCGVDEDPQNASEQIRKLQKAGFIVLPSNAQAARVVGKIIKTMAKTPV